MVYATAFRMVAIEKENEIKKYAYINDLESC